MLTPREEAVGRLYGLRNAAQLGGIKAMRALAGELETLSATEELTEPLRRRLLEAAGLAAREARGRLGRQEAAGIARRLDQIIDAVELLLDGDPRDAQPPPLAEEGGAAAPTALGVA